MIPSQEAAKRIIGAKLINAGQSPYAPDYVLVHENLAKQFVSAVDMIIADFFQGQHGEYSHDYGRIINDEHFHNLVELLEDDVILHFLISL